MPALSANWLHPITNRFGVEVLLGTHDGWLEDLQAVICRIVISRGILDLDLGLTHFHERFQVISAVGIE